MQRQTMRKLTPMQLETLTAFYYGEVEYINQQIRAPSGTIVAHAVFITSEAGNISGRVRSLFKRGLIKLHYPKDMGEGVGGFIVFVTPAGIKEMEAIDA